MPGAPRRLLRPRSSVELPGRPPPAGDTPGRAPAAASHPGPSRLALGASLVHAPLACGSRSGWDRRRRCSGRGRASSPGLVTLRLPTRSRRRAARTSESPRASESLPVSDGQGLGQADGIRVAAGTESERPSHGRRGHPSRPGLGADGIRVATGHASVCHVSRHRPPLTAAAIDRASCSGCLRARGHRVSVGVRVGPGAGGGSGSPGHAPYRGHPRIPRRGRYDSAGNNLNAVTWNYTIITHCQLE